MNLHIHLILSAAFNNTNLLRGVFISFLLLTFSCGQRNNELNVPGYELEVGEIKVSEQAMDEIIQNVSSPIEMAYLIKEIGVPFSTKYLSNLESTDNYSTSFKMAFTLGMLGADLGYLNVYGKTGSSVNYLSAISRISDGLKVSQFFDFSTIKRLATSSSNIDSLMYLSVHSFNQMDDFLRVTDRSNLSALMITGVWMEGIYQVTQVVKEEYNEKLAEYIGEQKITLNDLLVILNNYKKDEQFNTLINDFTQLKTCFEKVNISYTMGEAKTIEKNGMLMVIQEETSVVEIPEGVLDEIIATTAIIRNKQLMKE